MKRVQTLLMNLACVMYCVRHDENDWKNEVLKKDSNVIGNKQLIRTDAVKLTGEN